MSFPFFLVFLGCREQRAERRRSEGPQPHTIDLSFPKRVFVSVSPPLPFSPGPFFDLPHPVCTDGLHIEES